MTSTSLRALAGAAALLAAAPAAHAQIGIAVGANFTTLGDAKDGATTATFDKASGFNAGVYYDLPLGPIALRPGIFYTDLGSLRAETSTAIADSFKVSLIEAPIDVRIRLPMPVLKPYVLAGPVLRFANSEDDDFTAKQFSLGAAAGAGVELSALGFRPFAEARYQFGLGKFVDDFTVRGNTVTTDDNTRLNAFVLRVGLTF